MKLAEQKVYSALQIARLRKLNRLGNFGCERARKATAEVGMSIMCPDNYSPYNVSRFF